MVVSNPAVSTTLGGPVGFWVSELFHAHHAFKEAGYEVDVRSPRGGAVRADAMSDPRDPSGYSADDVPNLGYLNQPPMTAVLEDTKSLDGVCALLFVRNGGGEPLIKGNTITGFADSEEDVADAYVGTKVMPFRIEDEARKLGANFVTAGSWKPFAIRGGRLITGQQQFSGAKTAELVIEALGV